MNSFLQVIILSIIEGLTEFLPVSSTGHLIIVNELISFTGKFAYLFNILIQLGAILAVIIYFRERLIPLGSQREAIIGTWKKTLVAILPAIVIGVLAGDYIEEKLFNPQVVAAMLILGGVVLIILESRKGQKFRFESVAVLPYSTVFTIGIFQCLAMVPGVSRSAATIIGAMLLGSTRKVAAEFSFFLAVPTMIAASGYSLLKAQIAFTTQEITLLALGFVLSFLVALVVVAVFMQLISRINFKVFGYYRIVLGIIVAAYFLAV